IVYHRKGSRRGRAHDVHRAHDRVRAANAGTTAAGSRNRVCESGPMDEVPEVKDLPVGIGATGHRRGRASSGPVDVPADRYWGAQTQRSLIHFGGIGEDLVPREVYHALGHVKKAAALANGDAGRLSKWMADLIAKVADEVIDGELDDHFPLRVWQTGSGTQSNMNVNEVISNPAIQLAGGTIATNTPVHSNDHVNLGQSSKERFPTP